MKPNTAFIFSLIMSMIFSTVFSLSVAASLSSKIDNLEKQRVEVPMDSHSETNLQDIKTKSLIERYNEQRKVVSQEIDKLEDIKKEMGVDWSF